MAKKQYKFIDLFAGIGGFHTAMHSVGGKCVFASEWDKNARISYEANYKTIEPNLFKKDKDGNYLYFNEDINDAVPSKIPNFDICCGGFPCQPFSVAGLKRGFEDTRGTLFFNIANIIKEKIEAGYPPRVLFLENVRGLVTHDKGATIKKIVEETIGKKIASLGLTLVSVSSGTSGEYGYYTNYKCVEVRW